MLFEGDTVAEAMRKALGIEAKKTSKPFGASKIGGRYRKHPTSSSKIPANSQHGKLSGIRKENDRFPFTTVSEIESARSGAKTWARN